MASNPGSAGRAAGSTLSAGRPPWLEADLARIEDLLLVHAGSPDDPLVGEASTHLLKAGGKRIRPALVLIASRAGEPGRRSTDLAAVAIELVHLATLYHDDVMDESDTRRGVPTAHSKWGIKVAVLAGDYLFAKGSELGAEAGGDVPGILARAIADVCQGQIAETWAAHDPARSVDELFETIGKKTAALFRASCELGAATSGASPDDRDALLTYGWHLGMAFQIVDDLLDLVGDQSVTGKPPGTDLKEGVYTLPVIYAAESDRSLAERLAGGERDVDVLLPLVERTGALEWTYAQALSQRGAALGALSVVDASPWKAALEAIAEGVLAQAG